MYSSVYLAVSGIQDNRSRTTNALNSKYFASPRWILLMHMQNRGRKNNKRVLEDRRLHFSHYIVIEYSMVVIRRVYARRKKKKGNRIGCCWLMVVIQSIPKSSPSSNGQVRLIFTNSLCWVIYSQSCVSSLQILLLWLLFFPSLSNIILYGPLLLLAILFSPSQFLEPGQSILFKWSGV